MRFILAYRDQWPLWVVQKHVFKDAVWVELDDIPDLRGKPDALRHLLYELRRLEWTLEHDGIKGWISANKKDNLAMRRLMLAVGARIYREDAEFDYLCKQTGHPPLPSSIRPIVRAVHQERLSHGTA